MRQYSCIQFVRFFSNLSAATQWTCSQVLDGKESTRFYIDPFHEYSKPKEITAVSSPSLYNIISKIRWVLPGQGNLRSESFILQYVRENIRLAFMFANTHLL